MMLSLYIAFWETSILNASTLDVTNELLSFTNVPKYLPRTSGAAHFHISWFLFKKWLFVQIVKKS